jgi:hypothetical protein
MSRETPFDARRRVVGPREASQVRRLLILLPPVIVLLLALAQVLPDAAERTALGLVSETAATVSYAGAGVGVWMIAGVVVSVLVLRSGPRCISAPARHHPGHDAPSDFPGPTSNGDVQP